MSKNTVLIEVTLPRLPCDNIVKYKGVISGKDLLTVHSCINIMESIYEHYSDHVDNNGRIKFHDTELIKAIKFLKSNVDKYYPFVSRKALLNCISLAELILTKYDIMVSSGKELDFPTVCNHKFAVFKESDGTLRMRVESQYYTGTVSLFD